MFSANTTATYGHKEEVLTLQTFKLSNTIRSELTFQSDTFSDSDGPGVGIKAEVPLRVRRVLVPSEGHPTVLTAVRICGSDLRT